MQCPACKSRVREGAKICGQCGTRLGGTSGPVRPPSDDQSGPTALDSPYLQQKDVAVTAPVAVTPAPTDVPPAVPPSSRAAPQDLTTQNPAPQDLAPPNSPPQDLQPADLAPGAAGGPPSTGGGNPQTKWLLIGLGAALVAVCVALVVLFAGKASSSKFSTVGPAVADGSNDSGADVTTPETTEAEATAVALGGVWPTPQSWADDRCEGDGYGAATSFETAKSKVAICKDLDSDSYYYQGYGKENGLWSPWLTATYSEGNERFVATYRGDPDTTYEVTPTWLSVTTPNTLVSFEPAVGSSSGETLDETEALAQLEGLMGVSGNGRGAVIDLAHQTYGREGCPSASDASSAIHDIIENRSNMLDAAQTLLDQVEGTDVESAASLFQQAMDVSLQFDRAFQSWINSDWPAYADGGCADNIATPAELGTLSDRSTDLKKQLVDEVNGLAGGTSLKSDWDYLDI